MATVVHNIDPDADTIIVLKNPLSQSAIGELDAKESASQEELSDDDSNHEEIHYHVSLSHLRLGSPHFKSMLSGRKWQEGTPNEDDGRHHINVEDWDAEALLIFLNVLHLRNRQVPSSVSLVMLAKIAVLVDYYNCSESFELSTNMWIKHLKSTARVPSEPCRDLMLWMFVAWVFKLPEEFAQTTSIAIKRGKQDDSLSSDLPIGDIVDNINDVRNQAIRTVVSNLKNLRDKYCSSSYKCPYNNSGRDDCSFECGSMLYGALTKELNSLGLLNPYKSISSFDTSFQELYTQVCNMKSPKWWSSSGHYSYQHPCRLNEQVKSIVDEVMNSIKGLDLGEF